MVRSAQLCGLVVLLCGRGADAMTFEEALAAAGVRPDAIAPTEAARARASLDSRLPGRVGNPDLQVGLGPGSTNPGLRAEGVEFQSTLLLPWALDDLGGARRRSTQAERTWLDAERARRLLEQRRHAARAWFALWTAQQLQEVAHEEAVAVESLAGQIDRAVSVGAAVSADALEARVAAGEARSRVLDAEGTVAEQAAALALSTGTAPLPPPRAEGAAPDPTLPEPETWPRWVDAAGALPEAVAGRWLARVSSLLAQEATAEGTSWMNAGAQVVRNSADQWQFYAMVGLRWSAFDRNQRARAVALGQAELARGEEAAARRRAPVVLSLALHEVEHSRAQEAWLRTSVVPAAEALVVAREEALRRGPGTVFDLLRARSARLRARASRVAAEGRRRAAELDAWLLLAALPRGEEGR